MVNVDDLKGGMVLAGDLVDPVGRFLLARGSTIQEKHIQIMKVWGITQADIEGYDQEKAAETTMSQIDPEILKKAEDYIAPFFQYSNQEHEAIREIKRLSVLDTARKLASRGDLPGAKVLTEAEIYGETQKTDSKERMVTAQALIQNIQLASFPDIYYRLTKVLNDPRSSASLIAEVISKDTSLSAQLLKLANSAFYGLPSKVDSITTAITYVGINEISTLATGVLAIRYFKGISPKFIDMKTFWMHAVACGTFASILARNKGGLSEERFFVAGLLHDIGRLIMLKSLPQTATQAILQSRKGLSPLYKIEDEMFGFDHTVIAQLLLKKWDFPVSLEQMVRFHHEPVNSSNPLEASIIHFANIMAIALQFGHSGEIFVPPVQERVWEILGISPSIFAPAISQAERLVSEIMKDFLYE